MRSSPLTAIDLFSGAGGLSAGLTAAGFSLKAAFDVCKIAGATYCLNFPTTIFFEGDLSHVDPTWYMSELGMKAGDLDLLAGCPPCQGFSRLKTLNGARTEADPRNDLIWVFLKFVTIFEPKAILLENVPGLGKDQRIVDFRASLSSLGYRHESNVLNAANYSVPQQRRRFVLAAAKSFEPTLPRPTGEVRTVRQAIGHLYEPGSGSDPLHDYIDKRAKHVQRIIKAVPKDGGSRACLPSRLKLACHKRTDGFRDVYGRMAWSKNAPTITGSCINPSKGRFLHPDQNRAITLREASILQGFGSDYKFGPGGKYQTAQLIGNAFPPPFARALASEIALQLRWKNSVICK